MIALAELGAHLRHRGLVAHALAAWCGTDRLSAVPQLAPLVAGGERTVASTILQLFVGGAEVPIDRARGLDVEGLHAHHLIDLGGGNVRARVAVLPTPSALVVCDRLDAPAERELVCWPDDSSYHLAGALPLEQHARWLDLGCGSAFAQLSQPRRARARVGVDLNPRAVRYATLGAALSEQPVDVRPGDLAESIDGLFDLVTCNAPIPEAASDDLFRPLWRSTDHGFVARVFRHAARVATATADIVVHSALDALAPVVAELPGERALVAYTPPGVEGFAVAWWRRGAPERWVTGRRLLSRERPHLAHDDRLAALAGTLAPL